MTTLTEDRAIEAITKRLGEPAPSSAERLARQLLRDITGAQIALFDARLAEVQWAITTEGGPLVVVPEYTARLFTRDPDGVVTAARRLVYTEKWTEAPALTPKSAADQPTS